MNEEIEPILIGEVDDIEVGSVENFEYEDVNYSIFRLESGFFATQGHCSCEDEAYISEGNVEGEEVECASCGKIFSIVSGDPLNDEEANSLKIYDVSEEEDSLFLNL